MGVSVRERTLPRAQPWRFTLPKRRTGGWTHGVATAALAVLAGFIALPLVSLLLWMINHRSFYAILSPVARDALFLSMRTTATSMLIIFLIGTPAAYALARFQFPGKRILDNLMDVPIVLPGSAAGIALLLAWGRMGFVGQHLQPFGITISFTTAAVVLAEVFVAAPFYVRQATVGFRLVEREVEYAAMVDGAKQHQVFSKITMPLAAPALIAGGVTAWARALGEFGATVIFAGSFQRVTQTMPMAIYGTFETDIDAAVALSVLVLAFSFTVMLTARYLTRKAAEYNE